MAWQADEEQTPDTQAVPTWSDYGKAAYSGAQNLSAQANAGSRYLAELLGRDELARFYGKEEQLEGQRAAETTASMSPAAQQRIEAAITSPEFWTHFGSTVGLKLAASSPQLVASVLPGGLVSGTLAKIALLGAAGGAVNTNQFLDEVYKETDKLSDEKLQQQSSLYRGYRKDMDEPEARTMFNHEILGAKPALNFLIGAAANVVGFGGQAARALTGEAASIGGNLAGKELGRLGSAATGAAEGGISAGTQGGVANAAVQQALMQGGLQQEFDKEKLANSILEPAFLGGLPGAVLGASFKGRSHTKETPKSDEVVESNQPEKTQNTGAVASKPPEDLPVGNPGETSPTRSDVEYPKKETKGEVAKRVSKKRSEPAKEPYTPDPEIKAALEAKQDTQPNTVTPEQLIPERPVTPEVTQPVLDRASEPVIAPERAPVTEISPPESAPVRQNEVPATQVTPQPEAAVRAPVESATPITPVTPAQPKVLEDLSPQAKQIRKESKAAAKANLKDATAEPVEKVEAPVAAKKGKVVQEKRVANAEAARIAVESNFGPVDEVLPTKRGELEAVQKRAQKMVADAEAAGVEIPQKQGKFDDHLVHLIDARKVATKPTIKNTAEFVKRDKLLQSGDYAEVRASKKVEGDINAAERFGRPDVEKIEDTGASHAAEVRETPEDKLLAQEDAEPVPAIDLPTEKQVYGTGNERKQVIFKNEKEGYTAVAPRAAPVVVAKKRKFAKQPRLVEDEKQWQSSQIEIPEGATGSAVVGKDIGGGERAFDTTQKIDVLHTTTAKDVLSDIDLSHLKGIPAHIATFVRRRFKELAPNVPIHIVTEDTMSKLSGDHYGGVIPDGMHIRHIFNSMADRDFILIRADRLKDPARLSHVVLHEVAHNVMGRAIEDDVKVRRAVDAVMLEARSWIERHTPDLIAYIDPNTLEHVQGPIGYGFTNLHEFMSEVFSNPRMQEALARVPVSRRLARELGLGEKRMSLWDLVIDQIRRVFRLPSNTHSALEAALRVGRDAMDSNAKIVKEASDDLHQARRGAGLNAHVDALTTEQVRDRATDAFINSGASLRKIKNRISSTYMLGDRGERYLPGMRNTVELLAQREHEKTKIIEQEGGKKLVREQVAFRDKHGEDAYNQIAELGFDASESNVNLGTGAKNEHLGKDATRSVQSKARLPELNRRLADLEKQYPGTEKLLNDTVSFFREIHNKMAMEVITNTLKAAGIHDPALAKRIFEDGVTEADRESFKTNTLANALNDAREFKQIKGWYLPFRRYGDWIATGTHEIVAPKGATKVADDTIRFHDDSETKARKAADAFVQSHELTQLGPYKKVWVDKNDPSKILPGDHVDAVHAFDVKLQNQHTSFHDTEAAATRAREELETAGLKVQGVRKRDEYEGGKSNQVSAEVQSILDNLEKQDKFKKLSPAEKAAVRQTIGEASTRVLGATRIQSSFLKRRNVAGQSHDLARVTADYAGSSAGYLARLRFQPKIDEAFSKLNQYRESHKYDKVGTVKRDEFIQELKSRLYGDDSLSQPETTAGKITRRLLQISRLDKLAGVSFHVINSQEPWTTSMPVIGGRHGMGQATKALFDSYNVIGARGGIVAGLKDTVRAYRQDNGFTDYVAMFKDEIANSKVVGGDKARRMMELLDYIRAHGLFNEGSIYEVAKYSDPTSNKVGRALDRADLMANQVGTAIESINRAVTALAEYGLEYKKNGGNHEGAMARAFQVTRDTMGDYSNWNASPLFKKNNAFQLALQFKKFAHKTYYLLGKTFEDAVHGDMEAARQFTGLMATHAIVAGAMGISLEPFKLALMAANVAGVTGTTWDDVEHFVRARASEVLGKKGGEVFTHGLPRLAYIDTSSRQGLDSLLTFGAPKTNEPKDIKSWLWDTMAGAPVGWLMDQLKAAQALAKGDFAEAAELAVPLKAYSDVSKAVRGMVGPKEDKNGRERMRAYSGWEGAAQAVGFTPSVKAENFERGTYASRQSKLLKESHTDFQNQWFKGTANERAKLWGKIEAWNKTQPAEARLTRSQLDRYVKTRGNEETVGGIRATKQNKSILGNAEIYNYQ